jgi:Slime mold cyclic AMP receptor
MPADCLWAFCLALNVFLTFHTFGKVKNIRKLEPYYIALCYGLPLIPALTYLILDLAHGYDIYGNATVSLLASTSRHLY